MLEEAERKTEEKKEEFVYNIVKFLTVTITLDGRELELAETRNMSISIDGPVRNRHRRVGNSSVIVPCYL